MTPTTAYAVETLVTLVGVLLLAMAILFAARRLGAGRSNGALELVGRLSLDARRQVYLVRVNERVFVLGATEAGMSKISELDASEVSRPSTEGSFRTVFSRKLGPLIESKPTSVSPSDA